MRWEYLNIKAVYNSEQANYKISVSGNEVIGIENILDLYGAEGWELVTAQPRMTLAIDLQPMMLNQGDQSTPDSLQTPYRWIVEVYDFIFKKPQ